MTSEEMAALHRAGFPERPWSAAEISELLARPATVCLTRRGGFLLATHVPPEAEILTLAVDPARRRQGIARSLVAELVATVGDGPDARVFLEVAAGNAAARALYSACGFHETGRRAGYYAHKARAPEDAVLMEYPVTQGQAPAEAGTTRRIG